jgi:threonine synthase
MRELFRGASTSEDDTARAMVSTFNETGQLVDPHTAVALSALSRTGGLKGPVVVMSTAHPAKFPEAVAKACGVTPALPRGAADLAGRPERFDRLPAEADTIKAYVRAFSEG